MQLRIAAMECVQIIADGEYHIGNKERVVALLQHLPLHFCDKLLGPKSTLSNVSNDRF